jgi:hypothetical protein
VILVYRLCHPFDGWVFHLSPDFGHLTELAKGCSFRVCNGPFDPSFGECDVGVDGTFQDASGLWFAGPSNQSEPFLGREESCQGMCGQPHGWTGQHLGEFDCLLREARGALVAWGDGGDIIGAASDANPLCGGSKPCRVLCPEPFIGGRDCSS